MAGGAVSPASLLRLISEIKKISACTGRFKKNCGDLSRRIYLLTHMVEEIKNSPQQRSEVDWWSELVMGIQAAKRILSAATRFDALPSSELVARRIAFQYQCVSWKLEKALSNTPYNLYNISCEVREQVELAISQFKRTTQMYGSINSELYAKAQYQPVGEEAYSSPMIKVAERVQTVPKTLHILAEDERSEKVTTKTDDKDSDELTIPDDFLCPISLQLMKDPTIVSTGQTYERSYIQTWIDCGNRRCPKTQQKLDNLTLTPNYILKSLISHWCTNNNINISHDVSISDMSEIRRLVRNLSSKLIKERNTALSEIRSLLKTSTENRIMIAEAGAIPILVTLMNTYMYDFKTQEYAITCVLNLSIYEGNKEHIMLSGAVISIVHVLKVGTREARENAAATLLSLSSNDENKIVIGAAHAIPALVNLLEKGRVKGQRDAAMALYNLCTYQGNKRRAVRAGIVNVLVKMMNESSESMVDEALTILSVLVSGNQDAKDGIFKDAIATLMKFLQSDQPRIRENAVAILFSVRN